MHCGEFETRLNDWLDGLRPELDYAASAHARRCSKCGELLAGHELLLSAVQTVPLPEPSPAFALRVVRAATAPKPQPALVPLRRVATVVVPLAAAVLVAFVSLMRSWFAPLVPATSDVAVSPAASSPSQSTAPTRPRYLASLLRETGQQVWPHLDNVRQRGLAVGGLSPPAWVAHMTEGLRPLPTSVGAGAMLMAQPLTSPMGAALMALQGPIPGA